MSDLPDRDRVTAILTKCEKHRARWPTEQNPSMTIKVRDVEMLGRLLEALDTIDKARELHYDDNGDCHECDLPAPCLTVRLLALNGGNEQ